MRWRTRAACVLGWALACAAGCDEGHTFITERAFAPGDFPSVQQYWDSHNHASDQRALSEPGQDVDQVRVFSNGQAPSHGVVLATTEEGTNLFASSFDGDGFTPLVEIRGENQNDSAPVDLDTAVVAFTNGVPGRDGDAVLLYRRQETGTTLDTDGDNIHEDDPNVRLYSFYFDVSQAEQPVSTADDGTGLIYGFSSLATFVDADPNGDDESFDANVESLGVVTDGLCFSAEFDTYYNEHRTGDETSFLYAVWTQRADTNTSSAIETRVWYSEFDLDSTSTRFPAPSTLDAPGLEDEDAVGTQLVVHNGLLLWTLGTDFGDSTDNDDFLMATVFDENGPGAAVRVSREDPDPSNVVQTSFRQAQNLYGDDHGIAQYYFFFAEEGFDDGNVSPDLDLMVAAVSLDGGDPQVEEVDEFVEGPDFVPIEFGPLRTAMGRGGDHIVVGWLQRHLAPSEETTNVSATPSLFVRGLDTRVTSSLEDALTGDVSRNHMATRLNADVCDDPDEIARDVFDHEFQEGLADGTTSPAAVFQSSRYRINLLFVQALIDDSSSTNVSNERIALRTAYVEFDSSLPEPDFTSGSGTASDTMVDTADLNWSYYNPSPLVQTNGGASAVDGGDGDVVVFYLNQGNNKDDADNPGNGDLAAFVETRLFAWRRDSGGPVEISSDGSSFGSGSGAGSPDFFQVYDFEVTTTPTNTDVTNHPDHGGDLVYILFREHNSNRESYLTENGVGGSPLVLRARIYNKTDTDPDLGNRFDPPLDRFPERVDTGQPSHVDDVICQMDGDTVALYFLSNQRLYYNEHDGRSWLTADGLPNPALVDHDSERPVEYFVLGDSRLCSGNSTLAGVPVLWTKREPDAFSPRRLKARIHR